MQELRTRMSLLPTAPARWGAMGALWLSLACLSITTPALADSARCVTDRYGNTLCPPADSRCVATRFGDWACSGPGGGAALDAAGLAQCGAGRCIVDAQHRVMCSKEAGGAAARDRYGQAVCTGGCAPGQAALCRPLRP